MSNIHTKSRNRLLLEKVVGSAVVKLDVVRERRIKQSKIKTKHTPVGGVRAAAEVGFDDDGGDYTEGSSIDDLISDLEELEDVDVEDGVDFDSSRVLTLSKLFGSNVV